ncbi:MAG: 1,4-alpha-glucan branching protein GlgB [Gammaproteobacteria bacterium]
MYDELKKIFDSSHDSPHDVLGPHSDPNVGKTIVRTFIPYAQTVDLCVEQPKKQRIAMTKTHSDGLFEAELSSIENDLLDYRLLDYRFDATDMNGGRLEMRDAYAFAPDAPATGESTRFVNGEHSRLFERFGAHIESRASVVGVRFGIWAPNAQRVSVVGNFNRWDGRCHPMQRLTSSGFWALFVPDIGAGELYKFEIKSKGGAVFLKTDPYAYSVEDSPEAAAIVYDLDTLRKSDSERPRSREAEEPAFAVYSLASEEPESAADFLETSAPELAALHKQGFTHVEIASFCDWKNEVASLFTPHAKFGTPEAVRGFIDRCRRQGLGVLIGVMPPAIDAGQRNLVCFDGRPLYENPKPKEPDVFHFDVANPAIRCLFLSYARFWHEVYGVDGFRLDFENRPVYKSLMQAFSDENNAVQWLLYEPELTLLPTEEALEHLFEHRRLTDPFALLGPHKNLSKKAAAIRAVMTEAQRGYVYHPADTHIWYEMARVHEDGLWQAMMPIDTIDEPYRLHFTDAAGMHFDRADLYRSPVTFIGKHDKQLFGEGNHYRIYEVLGAHNKINDGVAGVAFAVWAPNAAAVSVVGDFNGHDGNAHPMRLHPEAGIWELFVPGIGDGERYQFEIFPHGGPSFLKSDPYAFLMRPAPATDSVVCTIDGIYPWQDQAWLEQRAESNPWRSPISIYEVHLGSWRRGPGKRLLNYREIAERLIPYVKDMGFSHIEILPIAEHPYEPSWGYQVSNFYAPTARLGKPEELMAFVDLCHQNGIGVLLDWVAGHFPKDAHALSNFDGTHLYEHADPRKGEHKDWGTLIFNYGRHEAENFLIANALFWLEHYHFDGLRVDAVASMLYLDYSRKAGEWIPNVYGGHENLEAIEFLKHTNYIVHNRFPGVLMIAEESTAWPAVSRPTDAGGLGFGFKWNMGWMHDVLGYMQTPPEHRPYHHNQLTFVFHYAFDENFILSLSHDEVVHMKGSLYTKMPGCPWEKFANLRLLYFFMYTHPGKKLNFMGAEFAQQAEWSESGELQWHLADKAPHRQLQHFLKTLNYLYRNEPVLYEMDCRPSGFAWIDADNHAQSIVVFSRKARDPRIALIVVINFSAISRFDYRIGTPYPSDCTEIFNSNDDAFGGLGAAAPGTRYAVEDIPWHGQEFSLKIDKLPALSALLLKPDAPA